MNAYEKRKIENYSDTLDREELRCLIYRVTGSDVYADKFQFIKILQTKAGYDEYCMYSKDGKIIVEATSGLAGAVAFNTYLTKCCNSYFGPITQHINLPLTPPEIDGKIENRSVFLYRYFMNYCTFGYSLLFADWQEYERLTDWMMMSGVNLVLNIVGHEIVWHDLLMDLGYSDEEINEFICGPAYLPWQWMGNTVGCGGNLTKSWYTRRKELGNKINNKLRKFGAEVMVPGYFGMVPPDFKSKFTKSTPVLQGIWCDASERPAIISNKDTMFDTVADLFYKNTKKHFGDFYYFSGDPFHEGGTSEGVDVAQYGAYIVSTMKKHCPTGVWSLQGWGDNPKSELLEKMDKADILICDLISDKNYGLPKSYAEYPWIYSTTSNFGGTRIIDGNVQGFCEEPYDELTNENSNMVGIGMTMEAIAIDEIIYGILSENAIKEYKTDVSDYVDTFVLYRYGIYNENAVRAMHIVAEKILCTDKELKKFSGRESVLCARPDLEADRVSVPAGSLKISYNENDLLDALRLLFSAYDVLKDNECYRFDLMDIARQTVSNKGWHCLADIKKAYDANDIDAFLSSTKAFLNLFDIQEKLLATNKNTMLGTWLKTAENYAKTPAEKTEFVFIAKNILTLWADKDCSDILRDYAYKEWSGMMEFYKSRWEIYFNQLTVYFNRRDEMPKIKWNEFDYCFAMDGRKYTTEPTGDLKKAIEESLKI